MSSRHDPARNVPKRLRFTVLSRDNFTCQYCGRMSARHGVALQVDHIVPFSKGGETVQGNLITACEDCNAGKGVRSPHVASLEERLYDDLWVQMVEAEAFYHVDPYVTALFGPLCE